jgi:hypothetical protein
VALYHRLRTLLCTAVALTLALPVASFAQGPPDRDTKEINSYVLTEKALAKYTVATHALGATAKRLSGNRDDDDEGAQSLDATVARIDAIPEAKAAIQSAGMTTREYVVFSFSLFQSGMAAWGLSQPGGKLPPGVSMANVEFYRAHEAEIKKLGKPMGTEDRGTAEPEGETGD